MSYLVEEKARLKRRLGKEAIALAIQGRWQEAIAVNRQIVESFPTDVDAYNRLGRGLMELGEYAQAREAYSHSLGLEPHNSIAKKNLSRLSHIKEVHPLSKVNHRKVVPDLFIEETGRAGIVNLHSLATRQVLAGMAAGDQVYLRAQGQSLVVENESGEYLGEVEPKHGLRLLRLMERGNRYTAAIASLEENGVRVIIREVFRHPSQAGRPSFPLKGVDSFRPYVKESLLKYELEDEEESITIEEAGSPSEWEEIEMPQETSPTAGGLSTEDEENILDED